MEIEELENKKNKFKNENDALKIENNDFKNEIK